VDIKEDEIVSSGGTSKEGGRVSDEEGSFQMGDHIEKRRGRGLRLTSLKARNMDRELFYKKDKNNSQYLQNRGIGRDLLTSMFWTRRYGREKSSIF